LKGFSSGKGNIIVWNFYMYRKFLPEINAYLYENNSLWQFVARNFFLWQKISFCSKKFLPVARHLLFRKISDCGMIFAWKSCYSSERKILPMTQEKFFLLQKSIGLAGTFCIIWQEVPSCQVCDKMHKFLPTFRVSVSIKISWEPGSLAPGEYPTLIISIIKIILRLLDDILWNR